MHQHHHAHKSIVSDQDKSQDIPHSVLDSGIEKPGKPKLSGFDAPECAVEM